MSSNRELTGADEDESTKGSNGSNSDSSSSSSSLLLTLLELGSLVDAVVVGGR